MSCEGAMSQPQKNIGKEKERKSGWRTMAFVSINSLIATKKMQTENR